MDSLVLEKAKVLEKQEINAPVKGRVISMKDVKDEIFASEAMGTGVAIIPEEGKLYAPFDGKITMVFPTKHAIALTSEHGAEIIIHIGINTVQEDGKGFDIKVKENQVVKKGEFLGEFDLEYLGQKYDMTTPVIITNSSEYSEITKKYLDCAGNQDVVLTASV